MGWLRRPADPGADTYVGNDSGDRVWGTSTSELSELDTEVDVFDTRGGNDMVVSGSRMLGFDNHDVIMTGAGNDGVQYGGPAGGAIDNGEGVDWLMILSPLGPA